jgi:hypothetical protein
MTEDAAIRYTDEGQKTIDWYETIRNLREIGQNMGYTLRHYHDAMTRWVSFFKPSYASLISNMDANETARFLMEQNTPIPEKQKHFKAIRAMSRTVGQPLKSILSELHARARGYYADEPAGNRPTLINNLMLQGLQAFTAGTTNEMLRRAIQQSIMENEQLQWDRIMETAVKSEENSGSPMTTLFFFPSNQVSFFNTQVFHNTLHPNVNPLVLPRFPQVRPLVHIDRRLQQQFYTADCNQWQPHGDAFYNMQDPLMPIQPVFPMNNVAPAPPPVPVVPQPMGPPAQPINYQQQLADQQQAEQIVADQAAAQEQQRILQEQQRLQQQEQERVLREQAALERIAQEQRAAQAQAEQAVNLQLLEQQQPVTPQRALAANFEQYVQQQAAALPLENTPPPSEHKQYVLRQTPARLGAIQKNISKAMKNNNIISEVGSPVLIPQESLATTVLLSQMQNMQEQLNQIAAVNSTLIQPNRLATQIANAQPYMPRAQTPPRQNSNQRDYRNDRSRPNSPSYRPNSPSRNHGNNQRSNTPNRDGRRDQRSSYYDRQRSQSPYRRDNRNIRGISMSPGYQ